MIQRGTIGCFFPIFLLDETHPFYCFLHVHNTFYLTWIIQPHRIDVFVLSDTFWLCSYIMSANEILSSDQSCCCCCCLYCCQAYPKLNFKRGYSGFISILSNHPPTPTHPPISTLESVVEHSSIVISFSICAC